MSVSTPILTTSSETCASAAADISIAAANVPSTVKVLANILFPPGRPGSPAGIGLYFKHSPGSVNAAKSLKPGRGTHNRQMIASGSKAGLAFGPWECLETSPKRSFQLQPIVVQDKIPAHHPTTK